MIHVSNSIVLSALDLRLIMHRKSRSMSKRWMRTEFTAGPVLSTTCTTTEKRAASGPRFVAGCPCPDSKAQLAARLAVQVSELRTRLNHELNFPPNFEGLVLGCIDADFCKQILVGKLSLRSTQCTPLHRS